MKKTNQPHPLGIHRVLDKNPALPQAAEKLDNTPKCLKNEILIDVKFLQIDSASFKQLVDQHKTPKKITNAILKIVKSRGKMQNPVTGSGGMLLGQVIEIGKSYPDKKLKVGDQIATLISLTSTPLKIDEITKVEISKERISVKAKAILFASSIYVKMPKGICESQALSAFDICGAPALVAKYIKKGQSVLVIGLGKAGKSCLASLESKFGKDIDLYGVDPFLKSVQFCKKNFKGKFFKADAQNPISILNWSEKITKNKLFDFVINTTNVDNTEMSTILSTRDQGSCLFFGMATNFQKAALGAEAVGKDLKMYVGSGYTKGHAEYMIKLMKKNPKLMKIF